MEATKSIARQTWEAELEMREYVGAKEKGKTDFDRKGIKEMLNRFIFLEHLKKEGITGQKKYALA